MITHESTGVLSLVFLRAERLSYLSGGLYHSVLASILHRPKYIDWLELIGRSIHWQLLILFLLTRCQSQQFRRSVRAIFASVYTTENCSTR